MTEPTCNQEIERLEREIRMEDNAILAEQFKVACERAEAWKALALAVRDEYGKATSLLGDAAGRLYTFSVYHDAGNSLPQRVYDEAKALDEKIQATMKAASIPIPAILKEELS